MQGSLVDRGANGGIPGNDSRIISRTDRTVDISGIDNHEVCGLCLGTGGAVITSNHGPVIAIFNQYALHGQGKTIHLSGQIEHFQLDVND